MISKAKASHLRAINSPGMVGHRLRPTSKHRFSSLKKGQSLSRHFLKAKLKAIASGRRKVPNPERAVQQLVFRLNFRGF